MNDDTRRTPERPEQVSPNLLHPMHAVRSLLRGSPGPALEWAEAVDGDQTAPPDQLDDGEPHLSVERTFLFADLSGFTAFTREHGPHEAVELLAEFRKTARTVAARRGVRVAKWLGDGVMFVSVDEAPAVARAAHLVHAFRGSGIGVRVGLASGTALLFEGDDYIGEPVNLAAKLCSAARPGEVLAACATDDLPDWVVADGNVDVEISGVGRIGGVRRLTPVQLDTELETAPA